MSLEGFQEFHPVLLDQVHSSSRVDLSGCLDARGADMALLAKVRLDQGLEIARRVARSHIVAQQTALRRLVS
jgi:hypothetical protein